MKPDRSFGGMQVIRIFLVIVFGAAAIAGAGTLVVHSALPVRQVLAAMLSIPMLFLAILFAGVVSQAFGEAHQMARQQKQKQQTQAATRPTATPAARAQATAAATTPAPAPGQSPIDQALASLHTSTDPERQAYWLGIKHKSKAEREIARQEALIADEARRLLEAHRQDGQA